MVGFWGRRKREEQAQHEAANGDLALRARTAIVTADERIRTTEDELAFASAELGDGPTQELRAGLDSVRTHLNEAFHLHQLNHDEVPDTSEELRTRNARIVQLCDWAEDVLDERTEALRERVARVREAPRILLGVREDVERLRGRIPQARETAERMGGRYSPAALGRLRFSIDEVEQLLEFAQRGAEMTEQRRAAGRNEEANLALETATESVRRARSIIDGVDGVELEAMRAQSTLVEVIADSRGDLIAAAGAPRTPEVDEAARRLEAALTEVESREGKPDPFAELSALSEANAALDRAVSSARERASRPVPSAEHVRHDIDVADHALDIADGLFNGHRGWIGADARTRFAEAQRSRSELGALPVSEDTREEAQRLARRSAHLANEAIRLAQRDIDSSRPDDDDWGWGDGGSSRGRGMNVLGPVLGGVLLGGLIDEIFD